MLNTEKQVIGLSKKSKNVLIIAPGSSNGDGVSSALGLHLIMKKIGKDSDVMINGFEPNHPLSFLPAFGIIKKEPSGLQKFIISLDLKSAKVESVKYSVEGDKLDFSIIPKGGFFTSKDVSSFSGHFKYDLVFTIGAQDLDSLGEIFENNTEFFYKTPIINIDNDSSNEEYGQINIIDLTAASITEIIFNVFFGEIGESFDEDIATCLLSGMIAKTRSFKAQSVTPQSLEAAAKLISLGARRDEIIRELFRSRSISALKLWGRALARLSSASNGKLVWTSLTSADFAKTGSSETGLPDIIGELMSNIPEAKVTALFYESSAGGKAGIRTLISHPKSINISEVLKEHNPKSFRAYLQIESDGSINEFPQQIATKIAAYLDSMKN